MEASGSSSYQTTQTTIEKSIVSDEDPDPDLRLIWLAIAALMNPPS